jgi:hypothetical protein
MIWASPISVATGAKRLHAAEAALGRAADAAVKAPEIYRKRVAFVRAGLTFTQRVVENITLMGRYWHKADEAVGARVRENWEAIERLCGDCPNAINWGPVRPSTPRMLGLHPDHPNPKLSKKRPNRKPPPNDLDKN